MGFARIGARSTIRDPFAILANAGTSFSCQWVGNEWNFLQVVQPGSICGLCNLPVSDDLSHFLLLCNNPDLSNVRDAWLNEVESALTNAGQGAWWAALPLTLDGRGAVMHASAMLAHRP